LNCPYPQPFLFVCHTNNFVNGSDARHLCLGFERPDFVALTIPDFAGFARSFSLSLQRFAV
jgi:hypothetical protein